MFLNCFIETLPVHFCILTDWLPAGQGKVKSIIPGISKGTRPSASPDNNFKKNDKINQTVLDTWLAWEIFQKF